MRSVHVGLRISVRDMGCILWAYFISHRLDSKGLGFLPLCDDD